MIILSRAEWGRLDDLLGNHGFGGYYDLVETLKGIGGDLGITSSGVDLYPEHEGGKSINLPQMVQLLADWARLISHTEGFPDLVLRCSGEVEVRRAEEVPP